jgi:hypothetical protein
MTRYIKQQPATKTSSKVKVKDARQPLLMMAVSLAFILLALSSSAHAQQTVLNVSEGWDIQPTKLTLNKGYVIYSVMGDRCSPKLQITYILDGAKANDVSQVWAAFFNVPGDGLKFFSLPRFHHGTYTRESVTATNYSLIVGDFKTDPNGDGEAHFEVDLTGIPAGTYDVQFGWQTKPIGSVFYRTGTKYGVGFAQIKIP